MYQANLGARFYPSQVSLLLLNQPNPLMLLRDLPVLLSVPSSASYSLSKNPCLALNVENGSKTPERLTSENRNYKDKNLISTCNG